MIIVLTTLTILFLSVAILLGIYCWQLLGVIQKYEEEFFAAKKELNQWKYEITTKTLKQTTNEDRQRENQGRD